MAVIAKNYLDITGLGAYDTLIKTWANSENQIAYKTVLKSADGNSLNFYKKANATLSDTADATISLGNSDMQDQLDALASAVGATWDSANEQYTIALDNSFSATTIVAALNELKREINTLNGADTVAGSVAKSIKDAIGALDTASDIAVASKSGNVITITGSVKEEDGVIAKGTATDITLADVAATGSADDVSFTAGSGSALTSTNVSDALRELEDNIDSLADDAAISIYEPTSTSYAHVYEIYQGDDGTHDSTKLIGSINIPKDMVISGAEVKTVTVVDQPYTGAEVGDKYIDITIANATQDHIYVPCKDLVDVYTGGTTAEVTVAVANDNVITATINDIAATKITYIAENQSQSIARESVGAALARLDGNASTVGSVAQKINTAIDGLDTASDVAVASYDSTTDTITLVNGISETNGIIGAGAGDGITISPIATASINALFA